MGESRPVECGLPPRFNILDVSFNEDQSRVRKGHGAENLSRLRRLGANLLRLNPTKRSIKGQRKRCGWSSDYLFQTLFRGLQPSQAPEVAR